MSVNELIRLLGSPPVVHIPKRPGEPDCTWADITKIRADLGWQPKVSFAEGVAIMRENIDYWRDAPVWTASRIAEATTDWFRYLGAEEAETQGSVMEPGTLKFPRVAPRRAGRDRAARQGAHGRRARGDRPAARARRQDRRPGARHLRPAAPRPCPPPGSGAPFRRRAGRDDHGRPVRQQGARAARSSPRPLRAEMLATLQYVDWVAINRIARRGERDRAHPAPHLHQGPGLSEPGRRRHRQDHAGTRRRRGPRRPASISPTR